MFDPESKNLAEGMALHGSPFYQIPKTPCSKAEELNSIVDLNDSVVNTESAMALAESIVAREAGGVDIPANGIDVPDPPEQALWLSGFDAWSAHLSILEPKAGSKELWLKFGHDRLVKCQWDESGRFGGHETSGKGKNRQTTKAIEDVFKSLSGKAKKEEGGVFYIPTQPQGFPMADCVDSTDNIGIEIDQGSFEEQWSRYALFEAVTGISAAIKLTSGGKSIHAHYKAAEHLPLEQAQYLSRLFCLALVSDPVTVRLHQPMRFAGFFRKEKGQEQRVVEFDKDARYSYEELVQAARTWFSFVGWEFPEVISAAWWSGKFHQVLKNSTPLENEQRVQKVSEVLSVGLRGYEEELFEQAEKRKQRHIARQALGQLNGVSLIDLVNEASEQLGSNAFNWSGHDWKFDGSDKARGCCPFHESQSGSSAWISPKQSGGWGFACSACTDKKIGAFAYWLSLKRNSLITSFPTGKEFVDLAIEFLQEHGVSVPDEVLNFKPKDRASKDRIDPEHGKTISREEWEAKRKQVAVSEAAVSDTATPEAKPVKKSQAVQEEPIPVPKNKTVKLETNHLNYLVAEGFTDEQIDLLVEKFGVCSMTKEEATEAGFYLKNANDEHESSSGLYFPFCETFGQVLCDEPIVRENGKVVKYLTPVGRTSQALAPNAKVITKCFEDAVAGTLHGGIQTGAIAGASHYRKILKEGSKQTILFGSDSTCNPKAFFNLINAGLYLNGKIQTVPAVEGVPKAGLSEWFKFLSSGGKDKKVEYQELIGKAMKPGEFLLSLPDHWKAANVQGLLLSDCIAVALSLAVKCLKSAEQDDLVSNIAKKTKRSVGGIRTDLQTLRKKAARNERKKKLGNNGGFELPVAYNKDGTLKCPAPSAIYRVLVKKYQDTLVWCDETQAFHLYDGLVISKTYGTWTRPTDTAVQFLIQKELNNSPLAELYDSNFVASVSKLLLAEVEIPKWKEAKGFIPFMNGVLDVKTMQLLPYAPHYYFMWKLPYAYDEAATCEPILEWLLEAMEGDVPSVLVLLAFCRACVFARVDLQMFLAPTGPGGSGKGRFLALLEALLARENVLTTTLEALEHNKFETANIYGKRLVIIADAEKYTGKLAVLKSLTGQDSIRHEEKHKKARNFNSQAMVCLVANQTIASADSTSGLDRRGMPAPFNLIVEDSKRRNLINFNQATDQYEGEFVPCLPGFMNVVLGMTDEQMRALLKETPKYAPRLFEAKNESRMITHPLAAWVDAKCVTDEDARGKIGGGGKERVSESYSNPAGGTSSRSREEYPMAHEWLYSSYLEFCQECGQNPSKVVSLRRFSESMIDLCKAQLKHLCVKKEMPRKEDGAHILGIRLRTEDDSHLPSPVAIPGNTQTSSSINSDQLVSMESLTCLFEGMVIATAEGSSHLNEGSMRDETLGTDKTEGSEVKNINSHIEQAYTPIIEVAVEKRDEGIFDSYIEKKNGDYPSEPSFPSVPRVSGGDIPQPSLRPLSQSNGYPSVSGLDPLTSDLLDLAFNPNGNGRSANRNGKAPAPAFKVGDRVYMFAKKAEGVIVDVGDGELYVKGDGVEKPTWQPITQVRLK